MGIRRILAALCIVAIFITGIGVAIYLFSHRGSLDSAASTPKSSLTPPPPKVPTPEEFQVGIEVTAQECNDAGVCTYTYSVKPNYMGYHPLPEQGFTVFYDVVGGNEPQPGNFSVSGGQARVFKDVTVEGPPGAVLSANVTKVSLMAGPNAIPVPDGPAAEMAPQPINPPAPQPAPAP